MARAATVISANGTARDHCDLKTLTEEAEEARNNLCKKYYAVIDISDGKPKITMKPPSGKYLPDPRVYINPRDCLPYFVNAMIVPVSQQMYWALVMLQHISNPSDVVLFDPEYDTYSFMRASNYSVFDQMGSASKKQIAQLDTEVATFCIAKSKESKILDVTMFCFGTPDREKDTPCITDISPEFKQWNTTNKDKIYLITGQCFNEILLRRYKSSEQDSEQQYNEQVRQASSLACNSMAKTKNCDDVGQKRAPIFCVEGPWGLNPKKYRTYNKLP